MVQSLDGTQRAGCLPPVPNKQKTPLVSAFVRAWSTILSHKVLFTHYFVMYFIYYNKDGLKPLQIDVDSSDTVILPSFLESEWMRLLYK